MRSIHIKHLLAIACAAGAFSAASLMAESCDPGSPDYMGRKGTTIYVSKLGDNSDGSSWTKAFHTVQAAMSAVPDDKGGHRVIVRPDTYMEQNIFAAYKGAAGSYNLLQVDFDGSLGSGASGFAVFDAGDPKLGSTSEVINNFLQTKKISGEVWDRWIVRRVYATGADAGIFWDIRQDLAHKAQPLTLVVEDCVGVGRAFGGGVAGHINPRALEPVVFRRCWMCCLDWHGDAAAAYVRAENPKMPKAPDAVFEDCTFVTPDNALQAGNPGFTGCTRVRFKNCRMVSLNFVMPSVGNSTGIIFSAIKGKYLHVDLEDCRMMGFKVFDSGDGGAVSYSIKGNTSAYIQSTQEIPKGIERKGRWPTKLFDGISPPKTGLEGR